MVMCCSPWKKPDRHAGTAGTVCSHMHTDHDAVHEHVYVPEMLWLMLAAALQRMRMSLAHAMTSSGYECVGCGQEYGTNMSGS